jgi:hypothetical protein
MVLSAQAAWARKVATVLSQVGALITLAVV